MNESRFLYLIQGAPRAQLADALLEYRAFAENHPDEPLTETLLRVSREVRVALKEKRRILRATGDPGKVNERIALSDDQRATLQRSRKKRLEGRTT